MKALPVSDALKLAIHTLALLAEEPDRRWTTQQVADSLRASSHHLAKIHTRLVKAGIINSIRGPNGGLKLARTPDSIGLLEVHQVIEGELKLEHCMFGQPVCGRVNCIFGSLVSDMTTMMTDFFEGKTLSDLMENSHS